MKRFAALLIDLILVISLSAPAAASSAGETLVSSPCAVLMERSTGEVLYAKAEHERRAPASVTKVMTMLLIVEAVDSGLLKLDDTVTGSARAASMGGSQIWLKEGEELSVSDMLKCIAVVSANDCAVAMAEHLAGSEDAFVERMNKRASELGCEDTNFKNCTGLFDDPEHYTSAYDIALMSRELLSHAWIRDYTTIWMDSIRNGASELTNTNKLVRQYEGCTGLKTGYTSTAGYCLSASAERDGVEYIAVIMGGESIESRNGDAKALLSYGFANYALVPLRAPSALPPVRVELGASDCVQPVYSGEEAMLLPRSDASRVSYETELSDCVPAPVTEGDVLGTLRVLCGGVLLREVPIVASESIPRLSVGGVFLSLLRLLVGEK